MNDYSHTSKGWEYGVGEAGSKPKTLGTLPEPGLWWEVGAVLTLKAHLATKVGMYGWG